MICLQCRRAAGVAREDEVIYQYLDGRPQEMLTGRDVALLWHGECREARRQASALSVLERLGSQLCDCQHVLPRLPALTAPTLD